MSDVSAAKHNVNYHALALKIKEWGKELGFAQVGITDVNLAQYEQPFMQWLERNYHGDMDYMARHGLMRARPQELVEGTIRVISARMNYLPTDAKFAKTLKKSDHAYISRYALGRDYHKLLRKRLKQLGDKISAHCEQLNFRPFVDSAPILERPLAEKAGLGWTGKHSLVINPEAGSWFFLGELLVNIPLPTDIELAQNEMPVANKANLPIENKCGNCVACIKICPTNAIVEPYIVDARRCISYLTIEHKGIIAEEFRAPMGNRIYGCDDCQLICPWNKFAPLSDEQDFQAKNNFDDIDLLTLFSWDETTFLSKTEGSPIRRIGFQSWQRNIAIALGNVKAGSVEQNQQLLNALAEKAQSADEIVTVHIQWAIVQLSQQQEKLIRYAELAQAVQATQQTTNVAANPQAHKSQQKTENRLTARLIRSIEKGLPRDA